MTSMYVKMRWNEEIKETSLLKILPKLGRSHCGATIGTSDYQKQLKVFGLRRKGKVEFARSPAVSLTAGFLH